MIPKRDVELAIANLPEAVDAQQLEDLVSRLVFLDNTRRGVKQMEQGNDLIPLAQFREEIESWTFD